MREFVKYRLPDYPSEVSVAAGSAVSGSTFPQLSIIIPTLDGDRNGYFPILLRQLQDQTFQQYELIVVKGDPRQGRAINTGAALARGSYLMTLDDDIRIGHRELLQELVSTLEMYPEIGMAGVANRIPAEAPWLVRRVMQEMPRRRSAMVDRITVSDMAEHPCLIMRKDIFYQVGGENEFLPRGLDPYLRQAFRQAGYKVVVIPKVFIHHLPPSTFGRLLRQFFRNGVAAAYVNRYHPEWVIELTSDHRELRRVRIGWKARMRRQFFQLARALGSLRLIFFLNQCAYLTGFLWGGARFGRRAAR